MDLLTFLENYGFVVSLIITITVFSGALVTMTAFIRQSIRNGLIQSDIERMKQMHDENKHLVSKNNYLERKFERVEEMFDDVQRQINNLSQSVHQTQTKLQPAAQPTQKSTPPPPPTLEVEEETPTQLDKLMAHRHQPVATTRKTKGSTGWDVIGHPGDV